MFRTQYNFRTEHDWSTRNEKPSLTQQNDARDLDINIIMAKYAQTGQLPRINSARPDYGDFSDVGDYRECLDKLTQAKEHFNALPANVRRKFHNDPAEFVEFASNPENLDHMREMGLAEPKPDPAFRPQTEYSDDGESIRTTQRSSQRQQPRGADPAPRSRTDDLRDGEELRPHGDRKPPGSR